MTPQTTCILVTGAWTFLSFARETADDVAIVAVRFSPQPAAQTIAGSAVSGPLHDALDPDRPPLAVDAGAIEITLPPYGAAILHRAP